MREKKSNREGEKEEKENVKKRIAEKRETRQKIWTEHLLMENCICKNLAELI